MVHNLKVINLTPHTESTFIHQLGNICHYLWLGISDNCLILVISISLYNSIYAII